MASTATSPRFSLIEQPIPTDAAALVALIRRAWHDLAQAKADVARIERVLSQGEFAARRHNLSRADQFDAWTRQVEAEKLLVACLGTES